MPCKLRIYLPRDAWTHSLCGSCVSEPCYAVKACIFPCWGTASVDTYKKSGDPAAHPSCNRIMLDVLCFMVCSDGTMARVRDQVRDHTNMVQAECCNSACWDTCCTTTFCWGCAAAQIKRELDVWYGHANDNAPVYPGSPAWKIIQQQPGKIAT